jgi:acetyl esterase/lipase
MRAIPHAPLPDLSEDLQTVCSQLDPQRTPPVPEVSVKEIELANPTATAKLRALIHYPADAQEDLPDYVFFHAAGVMLGKPEMSEAESCQTVKEQNVVRIAPSYRLAPETPSRLLWTTFETGPYGSPIMSKS